MLDPSTPHALPSDSVAVVPTAAGPVAIDKRDGTLVPTPGPNSNLPPLNPFMARSTIAAILMVLTAVAPLLGETGVASLVREIVDNGDNIQTGVADGIRALDALIGLGSTVWFWLDRRAPNFRLTFRRR